MFKKTEENAKMRAIIVTKKQVELMNKGRGQFKK